MESQKEKALKEIQRLTSEAMKMVRQAEKLAIEHKLAFDFSVDYGMGGTFFGDGSESCEGVAGWCASSHSC